MIWQSSWRIAAALLLVGGLFGAVVMTATVRAHSPDSTTRNAPLAHRTVATTGALVLQPAPPAASTTVAPIRTRTVHEEVLEAVARSLDSWSRFASGGDLADVGATFHPDGPQFDRFENEAAAVDRSEPVSLALRRAVHVIVGSENATAEARVSIETSDSTDLVWWRFHLVRLDQTWLVWTVERIGSPGTGRGRSNGHE